MSNFPQVAQPSEMAEQHFKARSVRLTLVSLLSISSITLKDLTKI